MGFFDDLDDDMDIDYEETVNNTVNEYLFRDSLKEGIAALDTLNPKPYEESEIYKCFTSAEFHRRIGRFFAESAKAPGVSQSVIRWPELESLMQIQLPTSHMENFAAEYENFIVYLHMDDSSYSHKNVHFNHYLYNDPARKEMDYFDMTRDGDKIPYSKWEERISRKKVLVFGYGERLHPVYMPEPLVFLGYHNYKVVKLEDGSFRLDLNNSIGFQTSPGKFIPLI